MDCFLYCTFSFIVQNISWHFLHIMNLFDSNKYFNKLAYTTLTFNYLNKVSSSSWKAILTDIVEEDF